MQVMINRWNDMARFALMHSMATSLFFWFWSVRNETVDSLHHRRLLQDHQQKSDDAAITMSYLMNLTGDDQGPEYTSNFNLMGMLWNGTVFNAMRCAEGSDFSALILSFSPYLYPFSIEYSILVVGIWFIMWQNVGKVDDCTRSDRSDDGSRSTSSSRNNHYDPLLLRNHLVIHVDCSSANRGLFAGLVVMVATAVSIIVFFLAFSDRRYVTTGIWIGLVSESTLLILMICAAGLACRQFAVLDINANPVSQLDDLLLFICIPSFFLYGIFSIVPAMAYSNYMALFVAILQVIQVILQTPTIIDGLRRCSRSAEMQTSKPGRELITFLIICNLSMWFMETLEIKSYETNMDRIHFYGHPLWTLLSHVTLPLTLFYRFHSASCLVDIWKSAYEAPEQQC
uniref:Otopetrin-3 n=1 Tax=Daphnia galeata TaxID=27404 RepID=A0A8J2RHS1_9CRUS|nr:unnamed protein product [Daphnia galeata]